MDKRRRDIKRHPEWWWRCFYDENGEIGRNNQSCIVSSILFLGEQQEWNGEYWMITKLRNFKNRIHQAVF